MNSLEYKVADLEARIAKLEGPMKRRILVRRGTSTELKETDFEDGEIGVIKDHKRLVVCIDDELYGIELSKITEE